MNIIVGLGNPGPQYRDSRHNIGFMVVDHLAREIGGSTLIWSMDPKHNALIAKTADILLVKPQTFMNSSGESVSALVSYYKLKPESVWVVHDDIDLPLGKIRIRQKGGSAGHNGVESIMKLLGSDAFVRFRLGVGRGKESVIQFVLSRFNRHEAGSLKHLVKHGTDAVQMAILEGLDRAMNRYN